MIKAAWILGRRSNQVRRNRGAGVELSFRRTPIPCAVVGPIHSPASPLQRYNNSRLFSSAAAEEMRALYDPKRRRRKKRKNKEQSKSSKRKQQQRPVLPTHDAHGRRIVTNECLEQRHDVRDFMQRFGLGNVGSVAKLVDTLTNRGVLSERSYHPLGNVRDRNTVEFHAHIVHHKLLFPNLPRHLLASKTATETTESALVLTGTGMGFNAKMARHFARIQLLMQLHADFGLDLHNVPNIHQLLKQQRKKEAQVSLERAQMLLALVLPSHHRYVRTDTQLLLRSSHVTDLSMRVAVKRRGKGSSNNQLQVSSEPCDSAKESVANATIKAAGEPLREQLGDAAYDSLCELVDAAPAQRMSALHVEPLSDDAMGRLRQALGPMEERMERKRLVQDMQQQYEDRLARKMENEWQAKLQREQSKLQQFGNTTTTSLSKAETKLQDVMLQQEQQRMLLTDDASQTMLRIRNDLPISQLRSPLLNALQNHSVIVVSGGTGSGKSTQCPQYVLQDAIARGHGPRTRILVTQPRRIAAISVAERVADERRERLGESVGYTVRHNRVRPRPGGGSVEFVTTGVLLRRLNNDRTLEGISHVMIDEVHERDINTDFLLVLLKDLVTKRKDLRVILMSATLDAEGFSKYFMQGNEGKMEVPFLSVPTKPRYPVETIYLEDIAGETEVEELFPSELTEMAQSILAEQDEQLYKQFEMAEKKLSHTSVGDDLSVDNSSTGDHDDDVELQGTNGQRARLETLREAVQLRKESPAAHFSPPPIQQRNLNTYLVEFIAKFAVHVAEKEQRQGHQGSVLCFLPGWDEIKTAMSTVGTYHDKLVVLPLHSTVPKEEQHRIFKPAPEGFVKLIFATNIAESSVTINDALAIVDSGLVRELNWNSESAMSTMETVPTSKASATQRKGRAGRVAPGKCYRIYSRAGFHSMNERNLPEIQRTGLENTCLQACRMTNGSVQSFLSCAMDPPPAENVQYALHHLKMIRAIKDTPSGEQLTGLGDLLSKIPTDPSMGRMLLLGCVMQCLDPVLTAAACFSGTSPFYRPLEMRQEADAKRKEFSSTSDLVATVNAYDEYNRKLETEKWDATYDWARSCCISPATMSRIHSTKSQLLEELRKLGLVESDDIRGRSRKSISLRPDAYVNKNATNEKLYMGVWASGLPTNIAARKKLANFGTFQTRLRRQAEIHPSSVAFHRSPPQDKTVSLPDWFLYQEMVQSSQVFIRNLIAIEPEQIVLFGGFHLEPIADDAPIGEMILDDWVLVTSSSPSSRESLDLLAAVREELNTALVLKAMQPRQRIPQDSQQVVDGIAASLNPDSGSWTEDLLSGW